MNSAKFLRTSLKRRLLLSSRNGELKSSIINWLQIGLREKMDLILFLRSAKCVIYREQFLAASQIFFKDLIFKWPMIKLLALYNLTRSRTLRLLLDSLLSVDWLLLCFSRYLPIFLFSTTSIFKASR